MEYIDTSASETRIVFLSRVLVVILGVVAYFVSLGFAKSSGFFERSLYAYTIYGAAITPSLVAALFWERATKEGAIASIALGTITTILWKESTFLEKIISPAIHANVDAVIPAITLSMVSLILVSIITDKTNKN